ncbi:MAG TPA: hypothetical protein VE956_06005 [Nodularia sp. (in: cyanobacteria)]|nr:hypothetical protein [Nodularia sp. (in: cyanobacteria)]
MSQNQILSTIGINRNWLITLPFKAPKVYQKLVGQRLNHVTLFAEYTVNGVGTRAETISVKDARIIWRYFDTKGNAQAQRLIDALSEDSLISISTRISHNLQAFDRAEERRGRGAEEKELSI